MPNASGLVPDIALGIGGGGQGQNPLGGAIGTMSELMRMQLMGNQNKMFQQQFLAKQKIGKYIAGAPDIPSGIEAASKDPDTAAFVPEVLNSWRQVEQTSQAMAIAQQGANDSGYTAALGSLIGATANPKMANELFEGKVAGLSPQTQKEMAPAFNSIRTSLLPLFKNDPDTAIKIVYAMLTPHTPEGLQSIMRVNPNGTQQAAGQATNQGNPASPQGAADLAGDGKPLVGDSTRPPPSLGIQSVSGKPVMGELEKLNDTLQSEHADVGLKNFNAAQNVMGSLQYINSGIDNLAKNGGFLYPGSFAKERLDMAKAINTLYGMQGKPLPFPPGKVASMEDITKETTRMGGNVINQFFGAAREAASIIQTYTKSVPGVENTPLGSKLVADGLAAAAQRVIDQRNFENDQLSKHNGNLVGVQEQFNEQHPAQDYAKGVLSKYGLSLNGFESANAVRDAVKSGLLSHDQAADILSSQFGFTRKAK